MKWFGLDVELDRWVNSTADFLHQPTQPNSHYFLFEFIFNAI